MRDRAWGGLLLIFAAINLLPLPPGATTITGLPLLAITAQLAAGRHRPWFPRKLDQRGIGNETLRRIAEKIAPWEQRIERILKPRMYALSNHRAARVMGAIGFLLSVILWLPIPLGNHEPGMHNVLRILGRGGTVPVTVYVLAPLDRAGDRKQLAHEARQAIAATLGLTSSHQSPIGDDK